MEVTCRH